MKQTDIQANMIKWDVAFAEIVLCFYVCQVR